MASAKKTKGQFYTTNCDYILENISISETISHIIEPFAGRGDLIKWAKKQLPDVPICAYDIDPKCDTVEQRDTLQNPPDYTNSWVITNPPYLARNKTADKTIYDLYDTNDLYKCFIHSITRCPPTGGIIIIPSGFFFSPRNIDVKCRHEFMSKFHITKVRYFEETVFEDTSTTVVVVVFERATETTPITNQTIPWELYPKKETRIFPMSADLKWIIGGDIYNIATPPNISVRRYVVGQKLRNNEQQTFITLNAVDSGSNDRRISLQYKKDYIYPAQECARTYATLCISGLPHPLCKMKQIQICESFNHYIEEKRQEYWSLFLPQFRESKEYARKRIPFELAYRIVSHLIMELGFHQP